MNLASISENHNIEKRIAVTPEIAKKYISLGFKLTLPNNYGTHLGFSDEDYKTLGVNFLDKEDEIIKNSEIIFLEGYLWDEGDPKKAFEKAIQYSNKVAMSLSDLFCVERHKIHFLDLSIIIDSK